LPKQIVLLSGNISSGKSTLSNLLQEQFGLHVLKTKKVIQNIAIQKLGREVENERRAMQKFGESLDKETRGRWVRDALSRLIRDLGSAGTEARIVVDAVRILDQIRAIRQAYSFSVVHVHLKAPSDILDSRYKRRQVAGFKELASFSEAEKNKTESRVKELEDAADFVIDSSRCLAQAVLVRAATHLGLYARAYDRRVDLVVGGQYGSEGKGHITSYISRDYSVLVRVGGPNAGHKVFQEPDPYTHHQLPSGTSRNPTAKLILAPGCVLNAEKLMEEIAKYGVTSERLSIDPQAMIISKADIKSEAGLIKRIGSTGQGVGFASARRIRGRGGKVTLAKDVPDLMPFVRDSWTILEEAYRRNESVLVEGTQGAGLSLYHGTYPHVTSRDTSVAGCLSEAGIPPSRVRKVVMVIRTYPIRVESPKKATSGPMDLEIDWETISNRSRIPLDQLKTTEKTTTTARKRRVGEFDWALLRRAAALNGPTDLALTFVDYLNRKNEKARRYDQLDGETKEFIVEVERVGAAPVSLISTRFDFRSIIDRRAW
jgi:adenylosuccinate synthase